MGLTAIISSAGGSATSSATTVASLLSPVGLGVGGVFVAAVLILLLTYFEVFSATDVEDETIRTTLCASIIPLAVAFLGVTTFQALVFL